MAAYSDSLDRFRGQPWSNWTDFLGRESPISDEDDPDRQEPDCMRLPREDMGLFGLCPETESFHVVICEVCQASVKPQGLSNHYDKWHPAETKDALPPPEPPEKVSNTKSGSSKASAASKLNVGNVKAKVKRPVTVPCIKAERTTTGSVEETASSELEKIPVTHLDSAATSIVTASRPPNQASSSSGSAPSTLLQPVVALTPLGSPSRTCSSPPTIVKSVHVASPATASLKSTHVPTTQAALKLPHASSTQSTSVKSTPAGASTSTLPTLAIDSSSSNFSTPSPAKKRLKIERKCLPVKEREYDPDKHCGVWNGENCKPCTRSLTCKSHTLSMRRAVTGRSKHFDKLLADHKAAKDAAVKVIRSNTAQQTCQSSPMEMESNQALSPPPPGRVGGSIQLDIPASPLPTSLSTPMSSSVITPSTTPLANSAPNPSATATPFLGTLATTPLPSLPDLTEETFETHSVPASASKAPLLSSTSLSKDSLGLLHSPGPPQASLSISTASQPPSIASVSTSLPCVASTTPATSIPAQPSLPLQTPSLSPTSTSASITMELGFIVPSPLPTAAQAVTLSSPPSTTAPNTASSSTVPLAISIPNPVVASASGTTHGLHTNGTNVHTRTLAAVQMCDFQTLFEDVSWLKHHPRPLAVCTFSGRKVGALVCNTRRCEVVRDGLREALAHGPVRSPHSNDFYGNASTNISGSTFRPVLTNICKTNYLSPSGKILIPTLGLPKPHKVPLIPNPLHSLSPSSLTASGAIKAMIPAKQLTVKTTLGQGMANKEAVKNGQFHVPNILSGSLKRHADSSKAGGNANSKRTKRKHTQNVNPAEIIESLLARKTSRMAGRGNHVPLVTVAIANGLGNASTSTQNDTNDSKISRSSIGTDSLRNEIPKGLTTTTGTSVTDGTTSVTNVKAVSPNVQNVRIATAPNTVQLATPQITYLTTGPVTFQQIPVLSPQVISQIQLQSKSGGAGQSIPLKLLSGSGGVSLATATATTATRTMVLHQDKDRGSSES